MGSRRQEGPNLQIWPRCTRPWPRRGQLQKNAPTGLQNQPKAEWTTGSRRSSIAHAVPHLEGASYAVISVRDVPPTRAEHPRVLCHALPCTERFVAGVAHCLDGVAPCPCGKLQADSALDRWLPKGVLERPRGMSRVSNGAQPQQDGLRLSLRGGLYALPEERIICRQRAQGKRVFCIECVKGGGPRGVEEVGLSALRAHDPLLREQNDRPWRSRTPTRCSRDELCDQVAGRGPGLQLKAARPDRRRPMSPNTCGICLGLSGCTTT